MVAMVNHTAVAALHRERTHGDGGHASGVDLLRGGGSSGGLQENSSTNLGDHVDDQADGPFVWETTVSLTDLQKTDKNHIFFSGTRLCAQCILCWVLYNPGNLLNWTNVWKFDLAHSDTWRAYGRTV